MDKSERYLKEIAKNTADIAKELKKMNSEPKVELIQQGDPLSSDPIVFTGKKADTDAIRDALNDRN